MNGQCGKESSEFGGEECGGGNIDDNRIWEMAKAHAFSMKILQWVWIVDGWLEVRR